MTFVHISIAILRVCKNILVVFYKAIQIEPSAFKFALGTDPPQTYIKIAIMPGLRADNHCRSLGIWR